MFKNKTTADIKTTEEHDPPFASQLRVYSLDITFNVRWTQNMN